jgi:murein L,D-transpeptidase YcbB/YkuD
MATLARPGLALLVALAAAPAMAEPPPSPEPFWFDGTAPRPAVAGCLDTLARAASSGLDPADYDAASLASRFAALRAVPRPAAAEIAALDAALSASLLRLFRDVHQGRVDPRTVGFDYDVSTKGNDLQARLREARDGAGCAATFASLEPPWAIYRRLVDALAAYRRRAAQGEPPPVPPLPPGQRKVEPGTPWTGAPALAARLQVLGDLPAADVPPAPAPGVTPLYDGSLVEAVKRYQDRHALEPDGVVGPATIAAVNTPLVARVRQIELALERLRWMPSLPVRPTIVVNVPSFLLYAFDWDQKADPMKMRVVAGKSAGHETPLFIEQMRYVVFRPYWNPPPSIVRKELLPRARKDPAYLDRQDMEIVGSGEDGAPALPATPANLDKVAAGKLLLRQRPGPKNSLGLAKFIFPNANNVYMHGTPAQALFSRARRDYSHGCIRVEDPPRLAEWVLRANAEWGRPRIEAAMAGERPTQVNLAEHVTVIIFYDTVTVDPDGVVHFADDYYGHDARLERALRRAG